MSADQSTINKETGLKKFLLDPKSGVNSVRTYLNDNHTSDAQHDQQQTKAGPGSPPWNQPQFSNTDSHLGPNMNGAVPFNQQFGAPRPTSAASFHPDQQQANQSNQQQAPQQTQPYPHSNSHTPEPSVSGRLGNFVANILDFPAHQNHPEPSHAASPPMASAPLHPPSPYLGAFTQAPGDTPYPAPSHSVLYPSTNSLAQHFAGASLGGQPVDIDPFHRPTSALAPPPADVNSATGPVPAPRLYHRMILEFETLKNIFYAARIQPYHNDLIPVVAKLKALAREIWNLRYTRSAEFNYAEAAHQPIIIFWKEQFEQWSDTLEDMHDPILMQRLALVDAENDYPRLAGLSMTFAAPIQQVYADPVAPLVGTVPADPAAASAPADAAAAAPVKKKVAVKKAVVKKAAAADGEAAPVKKKVVKKKVAAE